MLAKSSRAKRFMKEIFRQSHHSHSMIEWFRYGIHQYLSNLPQFQISRSNSEARPSGEGKLPPQFAQIAKTRYAEESRFIPMLSLPES